MRSLIAKYIVKPFKRFNYLGRVRFWLLYWAYKLTGWHIRHDEWDFVLAYLPKLGSWQDLTLLDVGCSRNLFCYEAVSRGYKLYGMDLEKPDFKYPGVLYWGCDVTRTKLESQFDFVTCISVLEHIGNDGKGDFELQIKAIHNMIDYLKEGGKLLLTCPTKEFAQGHPWHGFNYNILWAMIEPKATIIEYTEKSGQICLSAIKNA